MSAELMTKAAYARHRGVGKSAVSNYIKRGQIVLVGTKVDVAKSDAKLDAEVDPAREGRLQQCDLLGDHQRCVVGQHHPTGSEPDSTRVGGDMADENAGGRGRDRAHVVMLGVPDSLVSPLLCLLCE